MTKIFRCLTLAVAGAVFVAGMLSACGTFAGTASASPAISRSAAAGTAPAKQYTIGIAEAQANDEVTIRRAYLKNYIAPAYNVKFIFSEVLKDDAATKAFIENCIDAGADAIIDFKSCSAQMARLCEENGLAYTMNNSFAQAPEFLTENFPLFASACGSDVVQVAAQYTKWLDASASADGREGFLIASILASQGNPQHSEVTRAVLEALQKKYSLTYEKPIDELVASPETVNAANDKNITITLFPGSSNKDTWLPGVSSLLQTGQYGIFLSAGQTYNQSATVINEVEQSFGINVKVASMGALGQTLTNAFNKKDPQGNPSVDMCVTKVSTPLTACLFAVTYNALCGDVDTACRIDGKPVEFDLNVISITSPEQLSSMADWDSVQTENWIAKTEMVDQMLTVRKPGLMAADIVTYLKSLDYDALSAIMN